MADMLPYKASGCGCGTTPSYGNCGCGGGYGAPVRFVPAKPHHYAAAQAGETETNERTTGEKALILLGGLATIYAIHRLAGGFTPPPVPKPPRRTPMSKYLRPL